MDANMKERMFWATLEWGPEITRAEQAHRAQIAYFIVNAFVAVREQTASTEVKTDRPAIIINDVCRELYESFRRLFFRPLHEIPSDNDEAHRAFYEAADASPEQRLAILQTFAASDAWTREIVYRLR